MFTESDSGFYAYHQWCLEQEAIWQEEQYELEQLEDLEDD